MRNNSISGALGINQRRIGIMMLCVCSAVKRCVENVEITQAHKITGPQRWIHGIVEGVRMRRRAIEAGSSTCGIILPGSLELHA